MPAERRTIAQLAQALRSHEVSATAVVDECLAVIADRNPLLNAFITVFSEQAREQARRADEDIAAGRYRGLLHGVPVSLKDLIDVKGSPTTAASRVREGHVAAADAPIVTRLPGARSASPRRCAAWSG
jgi:aspartyl-tRNA(Asn)/glutamyl-tRNA(Gln) amidotransferase subunit A